MLINKKLYAAIEDGHVLCSHESIIIGNTIEEVISEMNSWGFYFDGNVEIKPIMITVLDGESAIWDKSEYERRAEERNNRILSSLSEEAKEHIENAIPIDTNEVRHD